MTTKKTPAKSTTEKKTTAKKSTTAKKAAPKKAAAPKAGKAKVAETAPAKETLVATFVPEHPETAVAKEAVVAAAPAPAPAAEQQTIVLTIGMFQKRLTDLGFYQGAWDGHYGHMTKHAVARFQAANGLAVNGDANEATLKALGLNLYATYA